MAKRTRRPRKPSAPRAKKTNGVIDATADYAALQQSLGALQSQATQLSAQLNQVQVTIAKTQGAMEYLTQRGATPPEQPKADGKNADQKQQSAD